MRVSRRTNMLELQNTMICWEDCIIERASISFLIIGRLINNYPLYNLKYHIIRNEVLELLGLHEQSSTSMLI